MKLKATLIAAATLAVGVISSQAQVYSQNIVGYVNIPLTNGVLANVAPTDTVYAFNGTGYDTLVYKVLGSGHPVVYTTNWFKGSLASPNYSLNPGQSVFYLPAANQTNTQVGTVLTGASLVNSVFPAANKVALVSSQVPIAGGLTSVLGYKPSINDVVYVYNGAGYNTYTYKVLGTGHPVVYSTNWFQGSLAGEPATNVGQGFWIQPSQNTNWVQSFTP